MVAIQMCIAYTDYIADEWLQIQMCIAYTDYIADEWLQIQIARYN